MYETLTVLLDRACLRLILCPCLLCSIEIYYVYYYVTLYLELVVTLS